MPLTLKAWRRAREISQQKMADQLSIHVNTYQNWEEHPEDISIKNAVKICQILDLKLADIEFLSEG